MPLISAGRNVRGGEVFLPKQTNTLGRCACFLLLLSSTFHNWRQCLKLFFCPLHNLCLSFSTSFSLAFFCSPSMTQRRIKKCCVAAARSTPVPSSRQNHLTHKQSLHYLRGCVKAASASYSRALGKSSFPERTGFLTFSRFSCGHQPPHSPLGYPCLFT